MRTRIFEFNNKRLIKLLIWANTCIFTNVFVVAQKPVIDTSSFGKWPVVKAELSNDGAYSIYTIHDQSTNKKSLTVKSNLSDWKMQVTDEVSEYSIAENSKYIFVKNKNDSLAILSLRQRKISYISNIESFIFSAGKKNLLSWRTKTKPNIVSLRNLVNGGETQFDGAVNYSFSPDNEFLLLEINEDDPERKRLVAHKLDNGIDIIFHNLISYSFSIGGNKLLLQTSTKNDKFNRVSILEGSLQKNVFSIVWIGFNPGLFRFGGNNNDQLVFRGSSDTINPGKKTIFYYREGMVGAIDLLSESKDDLADEISKCKGLDFNKYGTQVILEYDKSESSEYPVHSASSSGFKGSPNLVLWNYKDEFLQSAQKSGKVKELRNIHKSLYTEVSAVSIIPNGGITRIKDMNENLLSDFRSTDGYVLTLKEVIRENSRDKDYFYYRINTTNGKRETFLQKKDRLRYFNISPSGEYAVWYDSDSLAYFSLKIATLRVENISNEIAVFDSEALAIGRNRPFGIAAWSKDGGSVFIYDRFDIWKLDLQATNLPINYTNNLGAERQISFSFFDNKLVDDQADLILTGFDNSNKNNGFWKIHVADSSKPKLLTMGAYVYCIPRTGRVGIIEYNKGEVPIKARNANRFLVNRMSSNEFPNYFYTEDFIKFKAVTEVHPEKVYNWMNSELLNFSLQNGKKQQ